MIHDVNPKVVGNNPSVLAARVHCVYKANDNQPFLSSVNLLYHFSPGKARQFTSLASRAGRLEVLFIFPRCLENKWRNGGTTPFSRRSLQESGLQAVLHVATAPRCSALFFVFVLSLEKAGKSLKKTCGRQEPA